jgi:hypothetical protein
LTVEDRRQGAAQLLLLRRVVEKEWPMSLVRLLGFKTLGCGCLAGHYRELATSREIAYIEEKGSACAVHGHRRNHTVMPERTTRAAVTAMTARAS